MPEFTPPKPPETKYDVKAEDFIKAIKGEPFKAGNGLYKMAGKLIKSKNFFGKDDFPFDDMQEYVVLKEARIIGIDKLALINRAITDYKIGFIFYKSILPGITIENTITGNWYLQNSHMTGNITIDENSQSGDIWVTDSSQSGDLEIQDNSQSGDIFINRSSLIGDIKIDNKSKCGYIYSFNNCQSGDILISRDSRSNYIWIYIYCESGDISIIDNSQSGNIEFNNNKQSGDIKIDKKSGCGDIKIGNKGRNKNIWINKNSICREILIEDSSECGEINISNSSRISQISIHDNSKCGDIKIKNNSKCGTSNFDVAGIYLNNGISIEDNSKSGDIKIEASSQSGDIWIAKNSESGEICVAGKSGSGEISIDGSRVNSVNIENNYFSFILSNAQVPIMHITDCNLESFEWKPGTKGELYIERGQIDYFELSLTLLQKDAVISLSDTKIFYFKMEKLLVQGQLLLRKIIPAKRKLNLEDIETFLGTKPPTIFHESRVQRERQRNRYNHYSINPYEKGPLFRIAHSSLGKSEITGCDLESFYFEYFNSKILDCFITGTKLPKNSIDIYDSITQRKFPDKNSPEYKKLTHEQKVVIWEQKIAIYNQFKKIYETQGDVVEAAEYHARAMHYQQKLLWRNLWHQKERVLKKIETSFEWFGFQLNRFSNNHGISWSRAILFICVMAFFFFCGSIWSMRYTLDLHLFFTTRGWHFLTDWEMVTSNFEKLPGFFLPTHSFDYLSRDIAYKPAAIHYFWDILGRIFIGYGIYQLIAAFRRHGRRLA
jgi:hypothetical protein